MNRCPKCGAEYPDEANFCPVDAGRLVPIESAAAADDGAASATGRLVGDRFELEDELGGRRTGIVHAARDRQSGEPCTVKLVAERVFDSELVRQRAERELKQLQRLSDPAAARILAHGRSPDGFWIACERAHGRTLSSAVDADGPLPEARAVAMAREASRALMTAAKLGVIHRDLAPKNVLVGDDGAVALINFAVPVPGGEHPGIAEFAAPEQIEGRPVDQRSNIYSLGALLYYAVTGRPPYIGSPDEVREAHLAPEPPEPPSSHGGASEALDAIVLKSLARQSSRRYMTLRQMSEALGGIEGQPASSTQPMGRVGSDSRSAGGEGQVGAGAKRGKRNRSRAPDAGDTIIGVPTLSKTGEKDRAPAASGARPADETVAYAAAASRGGAVAETASAGETLSYAPLGRQDTSRDDAAGDDRPGAGAKSPGAEPEKPELEIVDDEAAPQMDQAAADTVAQPTVQPAEERSARASATQAQEQEEDVVVTSGESRDERSGEEREAGRAGASSASGETRDDAGAAAGSGGAADADTDAGDAPASGAGDGATAPEAQIAAAPAAAAGGKGRKKRSPDRSRQKRRSSQRFRETLWFKKGELEEAAAATSEKASEEATDGDDVRPIEDRYADDGSLSEADQDRLSLRTGATQMMETYRGEAAEAGDVSEADLVAEMRGGRRRILIGIALALVGVIALVAAFTI